MLSVRFRDSLCCHSTLVEDHRVLLLVFSTAFAGFGANGVVLFGRDVEEFAALWRGSTLCILLGDIDFDRLSQGNRILPGILLQTFLVACELLLTNMLVAASLIERVLCLSFRMPL